jgi:hypothetical protein
MPDNSEAGCGGYACNPSTWEAEVGEFKASLGYMGRGTLDVSKNQRNENPNK